MSKILKKAVVAYDGGGMACGPMPGNYIGELTIDDDGETIYVSTSDMGEDANYFVSNKSLFDDLMNGDYPEDELLFCGETGSIGNFEGADEIEESEYGNCIKYLCSIAFRNNTTELVEIKEHYGKDLDEMEFPSIQEIDEKRKSSDDE